MPMSKIFDTDISRCINIYNRCVFGLFCDIYAPTNVCVKDIGSWASMVLQNYHNFIEMTSAKIYIVGGLKCLRKIHLNTQWGGGQQQIPSVDDISIVRCSTCGRRKSSQL